MKSNLRKLAVAASVTGAVALGVGPAVFAATPHITPANTTIKGALASGTTLKLTATVQGLPLNVSCTGLTSSGKTPANGLTAKLPTPPKFTGCTDNIGGTDTIKTSGAWSLTASKTGSTLTLNIPKAGAVFTSNAVTGCSVIVGPKGATKITGSYDNKSTWTLNGSTFAIGGKGCTTGATSAATATVIFTPGFSVVG